MPAKLARAVIVRSPYAHAWMTVIDATSALAEPGALAVLPGAHDRAVGIGPIPHAVGLMRVPDLAARVRAMRPTSTDHIEMLGTPERVRLAVQSEHPGGAVHSAEDSCEWRCVSTVE